MFVWTLEANLLGLWGLGMALAYYTDFHAWIATAQLAVSIVTFCLYYLFVALDLGNYVQAVAITHMNFMIGLLVTIILVIFDSRLWTKCFASAVVGIMPLSAAVGLSWITVVCFSSTAMYLSYMVEQRKHMLESVSSDDDKKKKEAIMLETKPLLIFHSFANSTSTYMPLLVMLYLYGSWVALPSVIAFGILDIMFAVLGDVAYWYSGSRFVGYVLVFFMTVLNFNWKQLIASVVLAVVYAVSLGIYVLKPKPSEDHTDVPRAEVLSVLPVSMAPAETIPSATVTIEPASTNEAEKGSLYNGGNLSRFLKIQRDPESQRKRML